MSYFVPTRNGAPLTGPAALAEIASVRIALDQAGNRRDAAGELVPVPMYLVRAGEGPVTVDRDVDGRVTAIRGAEVLTVHERTGSCTSDSDVLLGDDGTVALALADELDEVSDHLGKTVRGVALPRRADLLTEAQLPVRVKAEIDKRGAVQALETAIGIGRSQ